MRYLCPVTNITVTCDTIFPDSKTTVSSLHPLLALPISQLNKLNHNDNRHHKVSDSETQLLFCAYLFKTGLVTYSQPLPPKSIPVAFCHKYFNVVHTLANNKRGKADQAPKFNVTDATQFMHIKSYMMMLEELLFHGSVTVDDVARFDISEELEHELEARKKERRQAKLLKQNRERNIKQLKLWAALRLEGKEGAELAVAVMDKPQSFGVQAMKKARTTCLVELPEDTSEQVAKKDEIVEWLTNQTLTKLELNRALAIDEDEISEINAELAEIENSYQIIHDGETYINTALQGAKKVTDLLAETTTTSAVRASSSIDTPITQPRREDYSNSMAYKVALRKFNEGNAKL